MLGVVGGYVFVAAGFGLWVMSVLLVGLVVGLVVGFCWWAVLLLRFGGFVISGDGLRVFAFSVRVGIWTV